jgi:SNF family Na+-dependent transporter
MSSGGYSSLLAVLLLGFPAMLAEFVLGRRTHRNVVDALLKNLPEETGVSIGIIDIRTNMIESPQQVAVGIR